ncbi:MAG: hypothetical protein AAGA23_11455 [Pseudomonadota bacterium]
MADLSYSPKGLRPRYFDDPATDQLLSIVFSLASELSVTRERLDAVERLLVRSGTLAPDQVDRFQPTDAEQAARDARRAEFMEALLRSVDVALEQATRGDNPPDTDAIFETLK